MIATPNTNGEVGDAPSVSTLGDLLYADEDRHRVPEEEWGELIQAIAAGDQLALRALFERASRPVFTLVMRITNSRSTAEELTLDVFHDVWRRASGFDATCGSVLGWIMNQARSRAIDRIRFEQRKKRINPHPQAELMIVEADEIVDERERLRLRDALSNLAPEEREAIELAFFSELTYAEVAARLSRPLGTIKTRIRSGLMKLRRALAEDER